MIVLIIVLEQLLDGKSCTTKVRIPFIRDLKSNQDKTVKYIWCDNTGGSKAVDIACTKEGLRIHFNYTAPGPPQQNGCAECKFATLYGWVPSIMNQANLKIMIQKGSLDWSSHSSNFYQHAPSYQKQTGCILQCIPSSNFLKHLSCFEPCKRE
jgi:hypothetical protein